MPDLWVEYLGDLPVSVETLDMWNPGQRRLVDGDFALRLLARPDFRVAEVPVLDVPPKPVEVAPAPVKTPSRRSGAS